MNYFVSSYDFVVGKVSNGEPGLNVGAGGNLQMNERLQGFAEIKYSAFSFIDQVVFEAGVLFRL